MTYTQKPGGEAAGNTLLKVTIGPEVIDVLNELRVLMGNVSIAEVLRRAIGTSLFKCRSKAQGWQVLLERNGVYREIVNHG